jgi:DNA-binding transcriptional ArsR family regulator
MTTRPFIAEVAALIGDPARVNMLLALMAGRALTAGELAYAARVAPQTASAHLGKLVGAKLLALEKQGRHRYFRLASPEVAEMLEGLMAVAADGAPRYRPPFSERRSATPGEDLLRPSCGSSRCGACGRPSLTMAYRAG